MGHEIALNELDPGVRNFVGFLRSKGFNTTDSGDGESKPEEARIMPWPHVFISVPGAEQNLIPESQRLLVEMTAAGLDVQPGDIQATYDPTQGSMGIIQLVDDEERYIRQFQWWS